MIKNSLILKIITQSAAKATAAQQRSLLSLAKVVLDNKIALDNLLGGVSVLSNTTCCAWITTAGEVQIQLLKSKLLVLKG